MVGSHGLSLLHLQSWAQLLEPRRLSKHMLNWVEHLCEAESLESTQAHELIRLTLFLLLTSWVYL